MGTSGYRVPQNFPDNSRRDREAVTSFTPGAAGRNALVATDPITGLVDSTLTGEGQRTYRVWANMNIPSVKGNKARGWAIVWLTDDGTPTGAALFKNPQVTFVPHGTFGAPRSAPVAQNASELLAPRGLVAWVSPDRRAIALTVVRGGVSEVTNLERDAQSHPPAILTDWSGTLTVAQGPLEGSRESLVYAFDFTQTGGMTRGNAMYSAWLHTALSAFTDEFGVVKAWDMPTAPVTRNGYPAYQPSQNLLTANNYAPTVTTGLTKGGVNLLSTLAVFDDSAAIAAAGYTDTAGFGNLFSGSVYRLNAVTGIGTTTVTFARGVKAALPGSPNDANARNAFTMRYRGTGGAVTVSSSDGAAIPALTTIATITPTANYQTLAVENFLPPNQTTATIVLTVPAGADFYFIGTQYETQGIAARCIATDLIPVNLATSSRQPAELSLNYAADAMGGNVKDPNAIGPFSIYTEAQLVAYPQDRVLLAWCGHGSGATPILVDVYAQESTGDVKVRLREGAGDVTQSIAINIAAGAIAKSVIAFSSNQLRVTVNGVTTSFSLAGYSQFSSTNFGIAHVNPDYAPHCLIRAWLLFDEAVDAPTAQAMTL